MLTRTELLRAIRDSQAAGDEAEELALRADLDAGRYVDAPPTTSDARVWDDYRARQGYSGCHH